MSPVYASVAARVAAALGTSAELTEATSPAQLVDGPVDVAFLCGLPYAQLSRQHPPPLRLLAAPVLSEARYGGRPIYFSDVVVRRDSPVGSFDDLRGRSWAHSREDSFSGCLLTRYHLLQLGESEAFFGRVAYSGRHQKSIRQVLAGAVDASAIDSHVLGVERLHNPELDRQLRVIAVFGPSAIPPVVASARLPRPIRERIRAALCALAADPASRQTLAAGLIDRFVPINDRAYDDLRQKLAAVEAARSLVGGRDQLAGLGA